MDELFGNLKSLIKPQSCVIDNHIFRLHYKFSVIILLAFSLMVTARQYFGDPIDCISRDDIPNNLLDTYCWIHTTFSLEAAWFKRVGYEVPYPGVDKSQPGSKKIYHAYYQWVCFVLFFQAIFFYIPRYIWKTAEGGRVKNLLLGLEKPIINEDEKKENTELLVKYLVQNKSQHNSSFSLYCFTEVLNLINVIFQMIVMNRFLGGEFSSYGWKVLNFTEWDWTVRFDPMIKVFPRLTKCTFHRYGSSGDVQRHDAMCILPINIVNEKIYVFLWFWFCFLFICTVIGLIYRLATILSVKMRVLTIKSRCRIVNEQALYEEVSKLNPGDWFLLNLLSKNIDPINFSELILKLYKTENPKQAENMTDDN